MSIPTIKLNIWIDVAEQSRHTKNNTFLGRMKMGEIRIHAGVFLKKNINTRKIEGTRDISWQLTTLEKY